MSRYQIKQNSLFAFLEEHHPATFLSLYSVEPGEDKSKVTFMAEAIRYYAQPDPADDFMKNGFNPCYPGRWSKEESDEYKYMAVHEDFFSVEIDNDTLAELGLMVF